MPKERAVKADPNEIVKTPSLVIHAFGRIPPDIVEVVRATAFDRFRLKSVVGEALPYPEESYSERRGQYYSTDFLFEMDMRFSGDGDIHIGMTDVDLYVPEFSFVFGEASASRRAAVFSLARLAPSGENAQMDPGGNWLARRAATEAVHEIAHVIGLGHCQRPDCVMWFSNSLTETDRKGSRFCIDHQRELTAKLKALTPSPSSLQGRLSSERDAERPPSNEDRDLDPGP